jgi:hypothetical protein
MIKLILLSLLFSTAILEANVIFPAFSAPYLLTLFPVIIIGVFSVETFIYYKLNKKVSIYKSLLAVSIVNIVSWLIGVLITSFLPSGLIPHIEHGYTTQGNMFDTYMLLSFPIAYILSILIEGFILKVLYKKIPLENPMKLSFYANSITYAILYPFAIALILGWI